MKPVAHRVTNSAGKHFYAITYIGATTREVPKEQLRTTKADGSLLKRPVKETVMVSEKCSGVILKTVRRRKSALNHRGVTHIIRH